MPIPQSKIELEEAIVVSFKKLMDELTNIPTQKILVKNLEGHTKGTLMSMHNLVSYLLGWGELLLKWETKRNQGLHVDIPETGFKWNELGELAQKFYADYSHIEYPLLVSKLEEHNNKILDLIASKSNRELYETPWYEKWTLGRMIQLNTASPYKNALRRIRKWKKTNTVD